MWACQSSTSHNRFHVANIHGKAKSLPVTMSYLSMLLTVYYSIYCTFIVIIWSFQTFYILTLSSKLSGWAQETTLSLEWPNQHCHTFLTKPPVTEEGSYSTTENRQTDRKTDRQNKATMKMRHMHRLPCVILPKTRDTPPQVLDPRDSLLWMFCLAQSKW